MKKIILAMAITLFALASPLSHAASVSFTFTPNVTSGNISASVNFGTLNFHFSGNSVVSRVVVMDQEDLSNQNYNTVGNVVETTFSLLADTFAAENIVDITSDNFKGDISGKSTTIVSDMAYNYLAVHFGGYEALFQFATLMPANTEFTISLVNATKGGGLSNYRVYDSGVSEVPVPAALFLFAPALLGFMGLRRRNAKI